MIQIDCKDCGKRHPLGGPCDWGTIKVSGKPKADDIIEIVVDQSIPEIPGPIAHGALGAKTLREGYNEYMKLLMRERRGGLKRKPKS